jgi:Viral BACON domain/Purple acid Phosphatase, N-terminal domain
MTTLFVCLRSVRRRTRRPLRVPLMFILLPLIAGCGDAGTSEVTSLAMAKAGQGRQNANGSTISISPVSFAFSVTQGDPNPVHTLSISNSGKGQLNWSMTTTASWLTISPSTGTAQRNPSDTVTATADVLALPPGNYSATITVFGDAATNNGFDIPVTLTVAAAMQPTAASLETSPTPSSIPTPTASATLSWAGATDPSVTGYYVHFGTESSDLLGSCAYAYSVFYSFASLANAGSPTATITNLAPGTTYYFAVSAYNGMESLCSAEVSKGT